jgi:hypothetical protein
MKKPTLVQNTEDVAPIAKPSGFSLDKFKSKRDPSIAGVETLQTTLPHHKISEAQDFVRGHPNEEEYWSDELCFVSVPIKGQKRDTLHLIDEEIALTYLDAKQVKRFRLALATKPNDVFFLCHVPSRNLDNDWNKTSFDGCQLSRTRWVKVTSRKEENAEAYKISFARDEDAFPEPKWPKQSLTKLIEVTFNDRMIDCADHPALLRLIGAKQKLS